MAAKTRAVCGGRDESSMWRPRQEQYVAAETRAVCGGRDKSSMWWPRREQYVVAETIAVCGMCSIWGCADVSQFSLNSRAAESGREMECYCKWGSYAVVRILCFQTRVGTLCGRHVNITNYHSS